MKHFLTALTLAVAVTLAGCDREVEAPPPAVPAAGEVTPTPAP